MRVRWFLITILSLLAPTAGAVEMGTSVCDITPDVVQCVVPMAGYGARQGKPATGVHDALYAKSLYMREGETVMALVTVDLRSVTPELKGQIVSKTADLGLTGDNLMVCASHNHSGPSLYPEPFWQFQFGKYDPRIVEEMSTRIAKAIREAAATASPARVGRKLVQVDGFSENRRWNYDLDARNAVGEKPTVARDLWVMRIDSLAGECFGMLVNFATHPTILGADNMTLSAEWPGILQRELEELYPGAIAFFLNGALGDQSPGKCEGADDFERCYDFGMRLSVQANAAISAVETSPDFAIGYARRMPALPPITFSEGAMQGPYVALQDPAREALPKEAELQAFRIGPTYLVGVPGEPIHEVGEDIRMGLTKELRPDIVVVGLCNDYIGYIVNQKEYAHGGYEVDSRSYYGPGLGEFIVVQSIITMATLSAL